LSIEKHSFKNLIRDLQLLDEIPSRDKIRIGTSVLIVQKQDQRTGNLTEGIVKRILTSSNFHPPGIKVELDNGKIGRVQKIP
jgi:uncharacterized repeat protein (TIGR03833 family)